MSGRIVSIILVILILCSTALVIIAHRTAAIECEFDGARFDSESKDGTPSTASFNGQLKYSGFEKSTFKGTLAIDGVHYGISVDFSDGSHVGYFAAYENGDLDAEKITGCLLTKDFSEFIMIINGEENIIFSFPHSNIEEAQRLLKELAKGTIYENMQIALSIE